jgi:hypothetical protein
MHHVTQMLEAHPQATANEALTRCIEECFAYALTCTSCADACLAGEDVQELVRCIRLNLDCADVCDATGRVLTRQTTAEPRLARSMIEPAPRPAACVRRNASGTHNITITAASAPRLAAVASRPVRSCAAQSPPSQRRPPRP